MTKPTSSRRDFFSIAAISMLVPPDLKAAVLPKLYAETDTAPASDSEQNTYGRSGRSNRVSRKFRASILEYIPEAEWTAISDGTTTYDCSAAIERALTDNSTVEFPEGTYVINRTVRNSTSGRGLTIVGANQVHTIFKAGPELAGAREPMFWFGNHSGHSVYRLHFSNFRIEGGDAAPYNGRTSGAGHRGCIGIRLQECGYSYVGNFWVRGCHTAIENIGSIGLQLGGEWSMIFYCRQGVADSDPIGSNAHPLTNLGPLDTARTMSSLTLNTNVCRYQNIISSVVGKPFRLKGGLTQLDRITLQSCGFSTGDDLIELINANESFDYGGGPIISGLWSEGGAYRSVVRIENTRSAILRDSFVSFSGAQNEQGVIVKGSHGATIQGVSFRGTPSATPTESRSGNHAYYVHDDSKNGFFGPNYFAINQVTPKIEWRSSADNHIVIDNHRNTHRSMGLIVGAICIDGSTIRPNSDMPGVAAYNIGGVANYRDINDETILRAQKKGWSLDAGIGKRTANTTFSGNASESYSRAEMQAVMDALRDATRTVKALKDDLHAQTGHGLLG